MAPDPDQEPGSGVDPKGHTQTRHMVALRGHDSQGVWGYMWKGVVKGRYQDGAPAFLAPTSVLAVEEH